MATHIRDMNPDDFSFIINGYCDALNWVMSVNAGKIAYNENTPPNIMDYLKEKSIGIDENTMINFFNNAYDYLKISSDYLAAMPQTNIYSLNYNDIIFDCGNSDIAVFYLDFNNDPNLIGKTFDSYNVKNVNIACIINIVSDYNITIHNFNNEFSNKTILNIQAPTVDLSYSGTNCQVFAIDTDVYGTNGYIHGNLICNNFYSGGSYELHYNKFKVDITPKTEETTTTAEETTTTINEETTTITEETTTTTYEETTTTIESTTTTEETTTTTEIITTTETPTTTIQEITTTTEPIITTTTEILTTVPTITTTESTTTTSLSDVITTTTAVNTVPSTTPITITTIYIPTTTTTIDIPTTTTTTKPKETTNTTTQTVKEMISTTTTTTTKPILSTTATEKTTIKSTQSTSPTTTTTTISVPIVANQTIVSEGFKNITPTITTTTKVPQTRVLGESERMVITPVESIPNTGDITDKTITITLIIFLSSVCILIACPKRRL